MKYDAETLFNLLPAVYRLRDAEHGSELRSLMGVLAEQVAVLEENLEQAYDDLFIETAADWVVPYLGDLIGYRTLYGVAPEISSPRAEVAKTIGLRQRKGPAVTLEEVARSVTGWPARVVEFFERLTTTQSMNHVRPHHLVAPDLRDWEQMHWIDKAFDRTSHTIDVRPIDGRRSRGRHGVANVGIYLWRLNDYRLSRSPAVRVDDRRWLVCPLGSNIPLFSRPEPETSVTQLASPFNVPDRIDRRFLHENLDRFYGPGKSIRLFVDGTEVEVARVRVCDLSDVGGGNWAHQSGNHFGIDPVLGRVVTPQNEPVPNEVKVTFHYGFSANLGGGEYARSSSFEEGDLAPVSVTDNDSIQTALDGLTDGGIVEMTDSGRYEQSVSIDAPASRRIELRSADQRRGTLILNGDLELKGDGDSEISLNGILIAGGTLRVVAGGGNQLRRLVLRHCTLVPGIGLDQNGEPTQPTAPSLVVESANVSVEIEHSIVGGIRVVDGAQIRIANSIVDATDKSNVAYAGLDGNSAGGALEVSNVTLVGKVHTRQMPLASNSIFDSRLQAGDSWLAPVHVEQKQSGCIRFCYIPPGARVPRKFRCQPEFAIRQEIAKAEKATGTSLNETDRNAIRDRIRGRLVPAFNHVRYGQPAYLQLSRHPDEIRTGADDDSEMGAFHDLFQPQRETNLRVRLEEYLRFGLEAGIFYPT